MLHRSSFADNVIDSFAFFLFGCFDGILQQPPFQLLAVEIDVLAVGFEMGDSPLVGKLVHVGLRQPRKFACFGEVQDVFCPRSSCSMRSSRCSTVVFSLIIILFLAFNFLHLFSPRQSPCKHASALGLSKRFDKRRCATFVM